MLKNFRIFQPLIIFISVKKQKFEISVFFQKLYLVRRTVSQMKG